MRFSSNLTEAVFLKRPLSFLVEVVLPNRKKTMIRCPNLGEMRGCDILGTKVWYSNAMGQNCLPTWEVLEADGGYLVAINPELMKPLIIEAIKKNVISELSGYTILHAGGQFDQFRSQFILLESGVQQCYVGIEQVITLDERNHGIFPGVLGDGLDNLRALIQARQDGHRAILLYCVMHMGITQMQHNSRLHAEYNELLQQAISNGVEVLAYRATINLQSVEITTPLPIQSFERVKLS